MSLALQLAVSFLGAMTCLVACSSDGPSADDEVRGDAAASTETAEIVADRPPAHDQDTSDENDIGDAESDDSAPPQSAIELLNLLERSVETLNDFKAGFRYDKFEAILEETKVHIGSLQFQIDRDRDIKRFAIHFQKRGTLHEREDGPRMQLRNRSERFIFDGTWLVERNDDDRQFLKRQIVAPGETFDPFSLEEGLFPLPIGQPKDEVLERFDVEMTSVPPQSDGRFLSQILKHDDVYGLKLTPKAGTPAAEEYEHVSIFYDRQTLLPRGIVTLKKNGNGDFVLLSGLERNAGVDESLLDTSVPQGGDWRVDVQPLRRDGE